MRYGYARVSSTDQNLEIQETALRAAKCDMIRAEKVSGTSRNGRSELAILLEFMRAGDVLVVTKIDRLARSLGDLLDIVRDLEKRNISLQVLDQAIDTSTAAGKCFLHMLGAFAEFETNVRRERQMAGVARAKAAGVYKGRKRKVGVAEAAAMKADGKTIAEIARHFGVARVNVYRALARTEATA
jgi:DNA invertase Pin-like site-specific DNA recombinase